MNEVAIKRLRSSDGRGHLWRGRSGVESMDTFDLVDPDLRLLLQEVPVYDPASETLDGYR